MARLLTAWLILPALSWGTVRELSPAQMFEIVRLARLIAFAQPKLPPNKYFEYGYGILMAAQQYSIDPVLLIAITHQETSFRESLPEGRAGEIGICQIRKNWIRNPLFVREFGKRRIRDLRDPLKSFKYAAWILRDLKSTERPSRTLPYWCHYNSKLFDNRLKYFVAVNQNLVKLRKIEPDLAGRSLASVKKMARSRKHRRFLAKGQQIRPATLTD